MTKIFFPSAPKNQSQVYYYINQSPEVVIAKIRSLENKRCEIAIFPGDELFIRG